MLDNAFFDYISSSALSLVVSGNTGISPFLTLFVLGLVEIGNPELLNMGETMEVALASWWSIGILGLLTVGETVGKCIPAIDEMIDSAEVFVVPVISVLASLATMGVLPVPGGSSLTSSSNADAGQGQTIDIMGMFGGGDGDGGDYRLLQEDDTVAEVIIEDDSNDFAEGFITFTQVCLVIFGIGLSLLIHFFKMLVRVSSLMCSGGCCQPCITVTEFSVVIFGVVLSIFAPVFAIVACIVLLIAAGHVIRVRFCNKKDDDDDNADGNNGKNKKDNDIEDQKASQTNHRKSSITAASDVVTIAEDVTPLPPPSAPNNQNSTAKPDAFEAMTY
mmetsp:Transcript_42850/g.43584  ORF Transcript_42850/g.43584 Transcript_42850/m.43584 type:complete len:332 (-) Transcript_42850:707-1702(-)